MTTPEELDARARALRAELQDAHDTIADLRALLDAETRDASHWRARYHALRASVAEASSRLDDCLDD